MQFEIIFPPVPLSIRGDYLIAVAVLQGQNLANPWFWSQTPTPPPTWHWLATSSGSHLSFVSPCLIVHAMDPCEQYKLISDTVVALQFDKSYV